MSTDITSALIDLVLAVTTIFGGYLIAYARRHISLKSIQTAEAVGKIAVNAAEQMGQTAGWSPSQKLTSALQAVRSLGEKHGISLSDEQWRELIEREVREMQRLDTVLKQATPEPAIVVPGVADAIEPAPPTTPPAS